MADMLTMHSNGPVAHFAARKGGLHRIPVRIVSGAYKHSGTCS
jgi:hypothetical protein